ncbi:MAG: hypothetical protein CR991_11095 [Proteobacteria bacterium]|nr:MAG: hypothetical protein CR991_11095 [Pseudomonadota bacterium]
MASAGLLALLDDIATVLDDISVMTKVAAKKTAGVLGDDLALNAQQVTGIRAEREVPVVWAVAKGSFLNKLILVPVALLISAFIPQLITPLLMVGGAYLCYEGFEKVLHKALHNHSHSEEGPAEVTQALMDPDVDLVAYEKNKINGAIRTDFILSAEIIVIALGTVQDASLGLRIVVVSGIAILMTIGVYGLVAAIVKMDDAGLYLAQDQRDKIWAVVKRKLGAGLLSFAPWLLKMLGIVGTIAMFLVGGGIIMHGLPQGHAILVAAETFIQQIKGSWNSILAAITPIYLNFVAGLIVGAIVFVVVEPLKWLVAKVRGENTE